MSRQKRPAFNPAHWMQDLVSNFAHKAIRLMAPRPVLTTDDFLDLFVPSEQHSYLRTVYLNSRIMVEPIVGTMLNGNIKWVWKHKTVPLPHVLNNPDVDHPRMKEIAEWYDLRVKAGYEFGALPVLFDKLNDICNSPAQVKFYWPGIQVIAKTFDTPFARRIANELAQCTPVRNLPALNPDLRGLCAQANASIATAQMLGVMEKEAKRPDDDEDSVIALSICRQPNISIGNSGVMVSCL